MTWLTERDRDRRPAGDRLAALWAQPGIVRLPGVFRVVRMAGAVGTGAVLGRAATVTAIVTARVRGGVPLSDTVMTRLSVPVKPMAGIYVTSPLLLTVAVPCAGGLPTTNAKLSPASGSLGLTWLVPSTLGEMLIAEAVGAGAVLGRPVTVTAIVTVPVRGTRLLSRTVTSTLSGPVKPTSGV